MKNRVLAAAACAAVCGFASSEMASASTIPANTESVSITSATEAASVGTAAEVASDGTVQDGAVLSVSSGSQYGSAQAYLEQYISVGLRPDISFSLGGGQVLLIPLTITFRSAAEIPDNSQAQSSTSLAIPMNLGTFSFSQGCSSDSGGCASLKSFTDTFDYEYAYNTYSNDLSIYPYIDLQLTATASGFGASAYLDPIIAVGTPPAVHDPSVQYLTNGVTLTPSAITSISAGGGVSAAPEPGAWLLIILGLGGIGGWLRGRRARAGAPTAVTA